MGIIVDEEGSIKIELVERLHPGLAKKVTDGMKLSNNQIQELVQLASEYFSQAFDDYESYVQFSNDLAHGSYGFTTGHEGLNAFFFRVCLQGVTEEAIAIELNSFTHEN